MNKFWSIALYLSAIGWTIDLIRLIMGHTPDKWTIFISLVFTIGTIIKWAYNEWNDSTSL